MPKLIYLVYSSATVSAMKCYLPAQFIEDTSNSVDRLFYVKVMEVGRGHSPWSIGSISMHFQPFQRVNIKNFSNHGG